MWVQLLWAIIIAIIGQLLTPKPDAPKNAEVQAPEGIPTVEDTEPICVLFGSRELRSSNIAWYGDLKTTPIKSGGGGKK